MTGFLRQRPIVSGVIALVVLVLLLTAFPIVPETKQAVIVRFGKPERILNRYNPSKPIGSVGAGLAYRIDLAHQNMQTGQMLGGLVMLGIVSAIADRGFATLSRRFVWWS